MFRSLVNADGSLVQKLKSIYVDTTFCLKESAHIPTRQDCLEVIEKCVKDWFNGSKGRYVHVLCRYNYGYEYLMVSLSNMFNTKIHVDGDQYQKYKFVPSIQKVTYFQTFKYVYTNNSF